ncbi:sulfotransferase [Vibrio sp. SCSIO 43135]|uniref:sulfotransferase domain-containing protein n=1 Tax=Vibrio sp. SCSIO 43135 TaxID=2819096 RepID=UPI002074AEAB|nr:sulfotransferase domain-containing protein [Vibrio sp. SCSIO 43135]USD43109.1 sulfotransferase [Vibrio sp. SCSIO 43135]
MNTAKLPGAIVIGAPKAGTTTLCDSLARHPDVYMYPKKETHFYNTYYHSRGMEWYLSLFKDAPSHQLIMEGTPDYAMSNCIEQTIPRIHQHNPDTKLIFMVREPVERIESHYVQMLSNHREIVDQPTAFQKWPEIIDSSRYHQLMQVVLKYFSPKQVHVIFLDQYAQNKRVIHAEVAEFLGISNADTALDSMEFEEHSHKRENQGMDGVLLATLRKSRHYDKLNMLTPKPIIQLGKRFLRRKISVSSRLEDSVKQSLTKQLSNDWAQFKQQHRQSK